jgi:SAM-dependent methyltransferase
MHDSTFIGMRARINKYCDTENPCTVLDVGSRVSDVDTYPFTYRNAMPHNWTYVGCDIADGRNVDLVMQGPYRIQEEPNAYNVVISGQCLEHVEYPWVLVHEMQRVLKPGGWLILTVPGAAPIHRHPLDCWRILPDGWKAIARLHNIEIIETALEGQESWFVGKKRPPCS